MRLIRTLLAAMLLALGLAPAQAASAQLTWYGQATFKLVTPAGHVLLIDPWFTNPQNKPGKATADALDKVDLILVTHGHFDHVGQGPGIARRTGAKLVATLDLGEALKRHGGFPAASMGYETLGNIGGVLSFFDGEVRIALVPAVHSSHVNGKQIGASQDDENHWGGNASGFVVMVRGGPTIYHTGDTDLFGDMTLIRRFGRIDYMLACVGDHFTMGPERAADAVVLVRPTHAVPMHYGTFVPLMTGTPEAFRAALGARKLGPTFLQMSPGVPLTLR